MKRELFENVRIIPGGTGVAINRAGFLSAVLGVSASVADTLKIRIEHAGTAGGEFAELNDPFAGVTGPVGEISIEADTTANICIDLAGCKDLVKISVEGSAEGQKISSAVVLGDPEVAPV